jgi:hypothetical protein
VCVCARVCACIKETSQGFCIPAGRHGLYWAPKYFMPHASQN